MTFTQSYPIHSQATAWLRGVGMILRTGRPGFIFLAGNLSNPKVASEDLTKEAGS